ncbi:MAG: amidohydrolase family protein, partial [Oscillospiraceae bacterium]
DKLRGYLKGVASEGVTLVFPTLFSALGVGENTLEVISLIAKVADGEIDGAKIGGIHFEGPYLNRVGEKGTRTEPLKIDVDFVKKIIESAGGKLRLMGLAPELPNSDKLIALLVENGVSAAFTHTDCLSEEAFAAFDKGITVATHLCNVMVGIHHRDVGGLGAAILDERVWCELICDGLHVTNNMIKLILRAKPNDHVMMISDCTGYSGAPVGTYNEFLGGSGTVIVDDKGFVREPGGRLRGSSKPVLYGIKNLTENIGLSMEEALKLSSLNPCKKYGYDATKGSLKEGKDADFVIIDDGFNALETFVGGKKVFDRKTEGDKIFNNELLLKINGGK